MYEKNIHIGATIKRELKSQGRSVTWFANAICCDRSNAYRILKKDSIDLELLIKISKLLNNDFFIDISKKLCINNNQEKKW